jgi:Uma2 family endonuclease
MSILSDYLHDNIIGLPHHRDFLDAALVVRVTFSWHPLFRGGGAATAVSAAEQWESYPEQGHWTYDDWLQLPADDFRYEIIDGVLYMSPPPSTAHQRAVSKLVARMEIHAENEGLGMVFPAPIAVQLPDQSAIVQPDILFIAKERQHIVGSTVIEGAPDLIVEILSPSNWPYDRGEKMEAYRRAGVREYWIVDGRAETVEVFILENESYYLTGKFSSGETAESTILTGFSIPVDLVLSQ